MSLAGSLDILFEDNHCLALNKPCGWPSTHFDGHEETVDRLAKSYLKDTYHKPGEVFLGVVHRLDKPVSGVLLFARTSKSAARLSEQFRNGAVEKVYWAVVTGPEPTGERVPSTGTSVAQQVLPESGTFENWLAKNESHHRVEVVPPDKPGAQHCLTHFHVRARHGGMTLLELRPQTGRKHQLRVQLASRGFPIYGDEKYGSAFNLGPAIALHARSLTFLHPTRQEPITLSADIPRLWLGRFARLLHSEAG